MTTVDEKQCQLDALPIGVRRLHPIVAGAGGGIGWQARKVPWVDSSSLCYIIHNVMTLLVWCSFFHYFGWIKVHGPSENCMYCLLPNRLFAPLWKYQYLNAVLRNGRTTVPSYIQIYPEYRIGCDQCRIAQCHSLCAACQYAAADGMVQAWVGQKLLKRDILRVFSMYGFMTRHRKRLL
jgi:hypothetical protein